MKASETGEDSAPLRWASDTTAEAPHVRVTSGSKSTPGRHHISETKPVKRKISINPRRLKEQR